MWIVLIALLIGSFITYSLKEASASKDTCPAAISRSVSKEELYRRKALIDNLLGQKERQLAVLVKTPGKRDLVEVVDGQWPVAVEATYQVLKDPAGRIIFISEFPHSKSGDWEIMYNHYFDQHGRTFAYERQVRQYLLPGR